METAVQDQEFEIENPKSELDIAVQENSETGNVMCDAVTIDTSGCAGQPINRGPIRRIGLVVEFGDTLMGVHPNAQEIGIRNLSAGQAPPPIWPYRR